MEINCACGYIYDDAKGGFGEDYSLELGTWPFENLVIKAFNMELIGNEPLRVGIAIKICPACGTMKRVKEL